MRAKFSFSKNLEKWPKSWPHTKIQPSSFFGRLIPSNMEPLRYEKQPVDRPIGDLRSSLCIPLIRARRATPKNGAKVLVMNYCLPSSRTVTTVQGRHSGPRQHTRGT
jgi:hypothetical protein